MNGFKALKGSALALSLIAVGCAQEFTPSPSEHEAAPRDKGSVNGDNTDEAPYATLSYDALRSILIDFLGMPVDNPNPLDTRCGTSPNAQLICPISEPVLFLDANRAQLGIPIYAEEPDATKAPGIMSSGGFKLWIVAASSACGIAMENTSKRAQLFPAGISNYDFFFVSLLGRTPEPEEVTELNLLQSSFSTDAKKATAVCTAVLASLENLGTN